jgi:hypothetical protein
MTIYVALFEVQDDPSVVLAVLPTLGRAREYCALHLGSSLKWDILDATSPAEFVASGLPGSNYRIVPRPLLVQE